MSSYKSTTNHQTIKEWVEKFQGIPEIIGDKDSRADKKGIRFGFKNDNSLISKDNVHKTSWNEFFELFEKSHLAFIYQENPKYGDFARAYRFINRKVIKVVN